MINCYYKDGKIYDAARKELTPDENGIVQVEVDKVKKRFMYKRFVEFMSMNPVGAMQPKPDLGRPKGTGRRNQVKYTLKKYVYTGKSRDGKHRQYKYERLVFNKKKGREGFKVSAEKEGQIFGPYDSLGDMCKEIPISKSWVCRQLKAGKNVINGYKISINGAMEIPVAGQGSSTKKRA